jgi:dihydrofolate reductase
MREIVAVEFLSLDGIMQAPGHPDEDRSGGFEDGGWGLRYHDEVLAGFAARGLADTDAFLLGRTTYEGMARFWPTVPEGDPLGDAMNGYAKYVASTTLEEPLEWKNSTLVRGELTDAVRALKREPGKNIVILGSGQVVRTLMRHDLIDEYRIFLVPVVLERGKRLFDGGTRGALRLVESQQTSTGVVIAVYRPDR